jgi:hypothetical protein
MRRAPTNFGSYEIEYRARLSRPRRMLRAILQLLGAAAAVVLAGLFLFPLNAHAGRSCEEQRPGAAAVIKGMQLAERTAQGLDASGARVALLARATRIWAWPTRPTRERGAWSTSSTSAARRWLPSIGKGWAISSSMTSGAMKPPG